MIWDKKQKKVLVWGGWNEERCLNDLWTFDLESLAWQELSATDAPAPRYSHCTVWTGKFMIIHGGMCGNMKNSAHVYDPVNNKWHTVAENNFTPEARILGECVWTGEKMVLWGGASIDTVNFSQFDDQREMTKTLKTGGIIEFEDPNDPSTAKWKNPIEINRFAPEGRFFHKLFWIENSLFMWGGRSFFPGIRGTGARWFPK